MLVRRHFLKGLCAAVALSLAGMLPDLAARTARWRITIRDPYDPAVHVPRLDGFNDTVERVYEFSDDDPDKWWPIHRAAVREMLDRMAFGTSSRIVERIA